MDRMCVEGKERRIIMVGRGRRHRWSWSSFSVGGVLVVNGQMSLSLDVKSMLCSVCSSLTGSEESSHSTF